MPVSFTLNRSTAFKPLTGDQDGDGFADVGDILRHTLTIHNTGNSDATSVVLNDLLGGSTETGLMNISPIAFNDAFTAVGNTVLRVGTAGQTAVVAGGNIGSGPSSIVTALGNLLSNDVGSTTIGTGALAADDVTGFSIQSVTNGTSTLGGTFNIFADGSFNYVSQAGDSGVDTFTYTIKDAGINGIAGDADDTSSTATVSITITGQVWYVDSGAAAGGTGTSANPFNSITALNTANVDGANDYIYVKGNASGQLVLETGEHLIGTGADLDVAGFHLADDGTRSTITNGAPGFAVTLNNGGIANSNEIAGINLVSTVNNTMGGLSGTNFGTLTISNSTINTTGQAISLTTGTIAGTGLVSTDSTGTGSNNVALIGVGGSLALGTGTLSGASGSSFLVSGGTVTTTYSGNITQGNNAALLDVQGGHATGSLTFSTGTLSATNGTGLQFNNADGTYNLNGTNTLNGGDAGVDITNGSGGNFTFSSNSSITNPSGVAFLVNGGAGTIDYNGTISKTSDGKAIDVQNHSGGTVSFDGTVASTSASDGISFAGNAGAIIHLSNTLTINTSSSNTTGFAATGGGTIDVTGSGNTINSGQGTALNISNTDIGASDVTFQSISSNGGSANGIILDTTGSAGGLHVTGTGAAGTGGTIQEKTGADGSATQGTGIYLNNTVDVQLAWMNLHDFENYGIRGLLVNGFSLSNSVINASTGTNGTTAGFDEGSISFGVFTGTNGLTGTATITNTIIEDAFKQGLSIFNSTGTLNLVIDNATVNTNGGDGIQVRGTGSAQMNTEVKNSHFTSNHDDHFNQTADNAAGMNVLFGTNGANILTGTVGDNSVGNSITIQSGGQWSGTASANVSNNSINFAKDTAININSGGSGTMGATITNNTIGTLGVVGSGTAAGTNEDAIRLVQNGDKGALGVNANGGTLNALVSGNTLNQVSGVGVHVLGRDGGSVGDPIQINVTIQGNTFRDSVNSTGQGIFIESGASSAPTPDHVTIWADIGVTGAANIFTGEWAAITNADGIDYDEIRIRHQITGGNRVILTGYAGGPTDDAAVRTYLQTNNGLDGTTLVAGASRLAANSWETAGAPPQPMMAGAFAPLPPQPYEDVDHNGSGGDSGGPQVVDVTELDQAELTLVTEAVIQLWADAGASAAQIAAMHNVTIMWGDLPGVMSSYAVPGYIVIDYDAGGAGWNAAELVDTMARMLANEAGISGELPAAPGGGADASAPGGDPAPAPAEQPAVVDDGVLSQVELNLIVGAAIDRWAAAGATPEQIAAMKAVSFSVEDLAGLYLGSSEAGHITLDGNAAGFNWFVDATPGDDSEFGGSGTRLTAAPDSQAGVRMDLLTTIMHELGHQIGLGDDYSADGRDELMYGTINPGERRLPGTDDLIGSGTTALTGTAFALSPINIGTIPAGRTATVQWDSTVNAAVTNQIVPTFSNTSTITYNDGASIGLTATSNTDLLGPTSPSIALDSLTLGNLIFFDANNNGMFDGGDAGVNGVTLTLFADTNADGDFDLGVDVQLATTTTAGGGLYSFANLAPGDYIVRVDAANFTGGGALLNRVTVPGGNDPDDNADNDDNGVAGPSGSIVSQTITLTQNGETIADGTGKLDINNSLDFGFIKLNDPPAFAALNGTPTFVEAGAAVVLDSDATVTDADLTATNYSGATLTLARSGGAVAQDLFGGTGGAGLTLSGGNASVNGTTIGTFTLSAGTLVITFNASATQARVNSALQGITYSNSNDNPTAPVVIAYAFNDGNAGAQGSGGALAATGSVTVSITPTNDAPDASLSNPNLGPATEQVAFSLKNSGLSVSDVDGNSGSETVTLAVGAGALNVTAGTSGAGVSGSGTATVTITGTIAQINALLNTDGTSTLSYLNSSDTPPASTNLTLTIHDNGATGGGDLSDFTTGTISIAAVNDAPLLDLNGAGAGTTATLAYSENDPVTAIAPGATVTDVDTTNFNSGHLLVAMTNGFNAEDVLSIINQGNGAGQIGYSSGVITYEGTQIAHLLPYPMPPYPVLDIDFLPGTISQAMVEALLHAIGYNNLSDNPTVSPARTVTFTLNDGDGVANGGNPFGIEAATINIGATDDPAVALDDTAATPENATKNIVVLTNDSDPDGPTPSVARINGNVIAVGGTAILPSGATVKLETNGTLTYDPNGQFNTLVEAGHGAANSAAPDSFTYTLAGAGGGTATVSITVNGVASIQDRYLGAAGNDNITGTANGDFFDLSQGGNDQATGLGGNDGFFFGAAFTALDQVNGGGGTNDQIGLLGDYSGGLVLGPNTITNVEAIVVLPGFSYDITTDDGNVAPGGILKIQATQLAPGQSLTFDGSAEQDGSFIIYGGRGDDNLTGGNGNDGFYFGPNGFSSGDIVNGGPGGNDQLALDGSYGNFATAFELGGNVSNIEVTVLLPGPSGSPNSFNLTTNESFVATGATMTIFGLQVGTDIVFDGSHEHDGAFRFFGGAGNDVFIGSSGNDWIFGGGGGDTLIAGAGADTFFYDDASQSALFSFDRITGFDDSADKIDLAFAVTGFATAASSNLSASTFDSDLGGAFAGLTSHQAGLFTATGGDMAGRTFLVIDANGATGYQAGSDFVIEFIAPTTPIDNPVMFI